MASDIWTDSEELTTNSARIINGWTEENPNDQMCDITHDSMLDVEFSTIVIGDLIYIGVWKIFDDGSDAGILYLDYNVSVEVLNKKKARTSGFFYKY